MSEVRSGHHQTEVGVIPDNWAARPIRSLCQLINGRGFKPFEWSDRGLPIIRIQNLNGSDEFNYFSGQYNKKIEVEPEQLLFAWSGSRGTSFGPHIWRGPTAVLNYHTWKVVQDDAQVDKAYFLHALKRLTAEIEASAHGASALVHTQKKEMEGFLVPLPLLPEQKAIAEALGDADGLIEALEALIDKKRAIKQGAMQDLLTGHRRLPGFRGQWTKAALGGLGQWNGGATPSMSRADFWHEGTIPWVSSSDVRVGVITPTHLITNKAVKESSTTLVGRGAILFVTRSGILRRFLPVALAQMPIAINQDIKALTLRPGFLDRFVFHALVGASEEILASCMKSGTTVESIEQVWLKRFEIAIPPSIDEQSAIAAVLSDMDEEIAALEDQLAKARAMKQGMMQVLLTGEIRLI